jgi:hypothetical protein
MADVKITALTALTAADPINDAIPIVDVSDTTMAASGTTKRISVNNILGASGTATLASATITGAATVGTTLGVTGVSTFAAGTALLPALTTTGDTNTGIYYPAADTFAVTTGGTERYRVDSTGLGIGTTAAQKLTVLTNIGISATTAAAADDRLIFTENMASANLGSQIVWKTASSGNAYASIGITNGAAGNTGTLIFSTSSSIFGSNNVERMRIDNAGNLILQSSATPATLGTNGMLTVNATSNTNLRFSYRGSDGTTRVANITLA